MKKFLLATTMIGAFASFTTAVKANIIEATPFFASLGATGFGDAHRLLTLQTSPFESGSGTPVNVANGDAISGADKTETPTLAALGWASGGNVGLGLDTNQIGGSGITLDTLVLTIYSSVTDAALISFSLPSPITLTAAQLALQQGNGNSIFNFVLDGTEQAQYNTFLSSNPGASADFAGLASSMGCPGTPSATCVVSNDGADSWLGFDQTIATPVPGPTVGAGLPGLALAGIGLFVGLRRRRRADA